MFRELIPCDDTGCWSVHQREVKDEVYEGKVLAYPVKSIGFCNDFIVLPGLPEQNSGERTL